MKTLTAQEARKITKQATTRKVTDVSKLNTIMKNIAKRAEAGFDYYDYSPSISYTMAKSLFNLGFRIFKTKNNVYKELTIDDFINTKQYGKRISWSVENE